MITVLFIRQAELDHNGQVKSKLAARMILLTILIDTVITVNILNWLGAY